MADQDMLDEDSLIISSANSPQVGDTIDSPFTDPVEPDVLVDIEETDGVIFSGESGMYSFVYPSESGIGVDGEMRGGLLFECRICKEEDDVKNLETPCACCGSMEHAHRVCVQRWCYRKGDTTCEICHQPYKHGYGTFDHPPHTKDTVPPLDGELRIYDYMDPRRLPAALAGTGLAIDQDHPDQYSYYGSVICLCTVVVILTSLLLGVGTAKYELAVLMLIVGAVMLFMLIATKCLAVSRERRRLRKAYAISANRALELETDPILAVHP